MTRRPFAVLLALPLVLLPACKKPDDPGKKTAENLKMIGKGLDAYSGLGDPHADPMTPAPPSTDSTPGFSSMPAPGMKTPPTGRSGPRS